MARHAIAQPSSTPRDVAQTRCCIVGGGPAGVVLGFLLARAGVETTLLEEHADFDREFRGDSIHPSVMQIMDELGLADRLLQLRHTKIRQLTLQTDTGPLPFVDFSTIPTRFPYITMMPQDQFLEFMSGEAARFPQFKLIMGAAVRELVEEGGVIRGVRYRSADGWHEVRALLTVAADGRFSRVRHESGLQPIESSPPMDVLWFKVSRTPTDPEDAIGRIGQGHIVALLNRFDYWQVAYVIPKGAYKQLHDEGIEAFRAAVSQLATEIADRMHEIADWRQVSLLSVGANRLPRWYRPGLLLIGDAAHTMTPVGGVGINYAIQDAVVAANVLATPLRRGRISVRHLARVQKQRELPTRIIQALQSFIQRNVLAPNLNATAPGRVPPFLRRLLKMRLVRSIPSRIVGLGIVPVHVET